MRVEVRYQGKGPADRENATDYRFKLLSSKTGDVLRSGHLRVENMLQVAWTGSRDEPDGATERFDRAVLTHLLERLEAMGPELIENSEALRWRMTSKEGAYRLIDATAQGPKDCSYQERRGRDLFCRAAETSPEMQGILEERRGMTSRRACESVCSLPDTRLLCSNFMHLAVHMASAEAPQPVLGLRVCDEGYDARVMEERKCVPGGHGCWRRVLEVQPHRKATPEPPLALAEALDFLSAVWANKLPTQQGLLALRVATPLAELSEGCATRDEFKSRLSAFIDVLKELVVDDGLLSCTIPKDHTFRRLEDVVDHHLPKAEAARAHDGIKSLRAINDLRNGFQHAGAAEEMARHAAAIGLTWPTADWASAWQHVRSAAVSGLREVRQAIEASP